MISTLNTVTASVVGQIISTGPVTGNLARIMSRHCQMSKASAAEWDTPFEIDQYCLHELKFWHTNVPAINSRSFTESLATFKPSIQTPVPRPVGRSLRVQSHAAHRMFSSSEQETSSTYRELLAIHFVLQAFQPLLKNCNVKLFTDSKMAVRITEVGSMKFEYHQLAIGVFFTCLHTNIHLGLQWLPRTATEQADYLSRLKDFDDWEVAPSIFQQMDVLLGPHTLEEFAQKKKKVSRFFLSFLKSRYSRGGRFLPRLVKRHRVGCSPHTSRSNGVTLYVPK